MVAPTTSTPAGTAKNTVIDPNTQRRLPDMAVSVFFANGAQRCTVIPHPGIVAVYHTGTIKYHLF